MGVDVNKARRYELAFGVDFLVRTAGKVGGDSGNLAVLNRNIGLEWLCASPIHYGSITDNQVIIVRHRVFLL